MAATVRVTVQCGRPKYVSSTHNTLMDITLESQQILNRPRRPLHEKGDFWQLFGFPFFVFRGLLYIKITF